MALDQPAAQPALLRPPARCETAVDLDRWQHDVREDGARAPQSKTLPALHSRYPPAPVTVATRQGLRRVSPDLPIAGWGQPHPLLSGSHFLLALRLQSLDKFVEIAFKHLFQLMQRHPDAMICYTILREIVGANLLASLARAHLSLAILCDFRFLPLPLRLDNSGPQGPHRLVAILQLRPFVLATHHHTGRNMGDPHRRFRRIDALAPGAG